MKPPISDTARLSLLACSVVERKDLGVRSAFKIHVAQDRDLHRIISFLSEAEIDQGFCKPLSDRTISISERVFSKHKKGIWIFAEIENQIVSCLAIVPEGRGVVFSTFACVNTIRPKLAAGGVWEQSLKLTKKIFNASFVEIDSWEGNDFINRFLRKRGFKKIETYPDPEKRPASVNSVLYRMTLN